jgi:hypothetical protein
MLMPRAPGPKSLENPGIGSNEPSDKTAEPPFAREFAFLQGFAPRCRDTPASGAVRCNDLKI